MAEKIVLTLLIMLFLLFAYWQYNGVVNDDFVFKQQQRQKRTLRQEAQSLWPLYQAQQGSVQMPSNTSASNTSASNMAPTKASLKDEITQDVLAKIGWQAPKTAKTANQQTDKNQNTANSLANLINSINNELIINKQTTNANISNNEQKSTSSSGSASTTKIMVVPDSAGTAAATPATTTPAAATPATTTPAAATPAASTINMANCNAETWIKVGGCQWDNVKKECIQKLVPKTDKNCPIPTPKSITCTTGCVKPKTYCKYSAWNTSADCDSLTGKQTQTRTLLENNLSEGSECGLPLTQNISCDVCSKGTCIKYGDGFMLQTVVDNLYFGSCQYNSLIGYGTWLIKNPKSFGKPAWKTIKMIDPSNPTSTEIIKNGDTVKFQFIESYPMYVPDGWNENSKNYLGVTNHTAGKTQNFVMEVVGGSPNIPIKLTDTINIKANYEGKSLYLTKQDSAKGMTVPQYACAGAIKGYIGWKEGTPGDTEKWQLIVPIE